MSSMDNTPQVSRRTVLLAGFTGLASLALVDPLLAAVCEPTPRVTAGPFYVPGAPFRARLAPPGEPGTPLVLAGRVLGPDCRPLAGAVLDVWQANAAGRYSLTRETGEPDDPSEFLLRGRLETDGEGRYSLETVLPGHYGEGRWTRPRHLHLTVTHNGAAPLTTQVYFQGDPHLAGDPLVKDELIVPLTGRDRLAGRFEIALRRG